MFTFDHVTEATFDKKPTSLPTGSKLSERKKGDTTIYVVHLTESLTVPTTTADLRQLASDDVTEVTMLCGESKVKMTQACADYVRGRKLRSNQDQQQELRGGGAGERRGDALAYWTGVDPQAAMTSVVRSVRDRAYAKAHNAKLDRIAAAIEAKDEQATREACAAE